MSQLQVCHWNPKSPDVLADQLGAYDHLLQSCPVAQSDLLKWSIFRHGDVMTVLNDPETYVNASRHHAIPNALNGRAHTVHRAVLSRFFSESEMDAIEPTCQNIARNVVAGLDRLATSDAVADLADPVALRTMCAFLGWPDAMWTRVRDWIAGNHKATFDHDRDAAKVLAAEYAAIVTDALNDHRNQTGRDDLTDRLLQIEIDGHHWSDDEIIATLRNWIAGHGTVAAGIGIVIAHLAEDLELQRRLRANPNLIGAAIDEILRADGPLVANARTTSGDVQLGGVEIPAGERLSLMWIAANRDPEVFEEPEEVRLDRDQDANLLYGAGIHYCLGAPLARLEMRITVEGLIAGTREFRLDSAASPARQGYPGNGFAHIPLQLG